MKTIPITISLTIKEENELAADERLLLEEARKATYRSYAPYSNFCVGAAVELADGTIVAGSNQENAAYPSGLCAERTAMFYANSRYPDTAVRRLCIAARDQHGDFLSKPISPCGACRQVLLETELRYSHDIEIMLYSTNGICIVNSAKDLLPLSFDSSFMEV